MVSRIHYSEDILQQLLSDRLGRDEADVTAHVESCETCQTRLESVCQSGLSWDDVAALLKPDEASKRDAAIANERTSDHQVRFLEPSERPGSIGRFARYEVTEVLGRGGMGIVMRGFDPALNRHSAIKVLAPELASSAAARRRFWREAKSAAAVVHPHVVPIQTVDEQNGLPYLVMPVIEGRSLEDRVREQGPLELTETVRIAGQVAEGLAAAHSKGLVHRDVKPANVLLENGVERVMLTDFGLARAVDDASLTRSGTLAGTPQYMSPEQAHGDEIDHRSDLFSLGSLIYFMCTGRSPFRAETTMGVLHRIVNDAPRSLRSINPDVPVWLEQIVLRLLTKQPDERFQSAGEVAELFNEWQTHLHQPDKNPPPQPISLKEASDPPKSRWRKWLAGTSAAALLLVASIVIVLETGKGTLRIETDSDTPVPIRVVQGNETVDELTVTSAGATTRLRAGKYTVEIDGQADGWEVADSQITLTRGGDRIVTVREMTPPAAVDSQAETITVYVATSGGIRIDNESVPLAEMATKLQSLRKDKATLKFLVVSHRSAKSFPVVSEVVALIRSEFGDETSVNIRVAEEAESREYDVSDIPANERAHLRSLIRRLSLDPYVLTSVSNTNFNSTNWFVFTTPAGHTRVREKLAAWRAGDHSVPPGTLPLPPTVALPPGEEAKDDDPEGLFHGTWQRGELDLVPRDGEGSDARVSPGGYGNGNGAIDASVDAERWFEVPESVRKELMQRLPGKKDAKPPATPILPKTEPPAESAAEESVSLADPSSKRDDVTFVRPAVRPRLHSVVQVRVIRNPAPPEPSSKLKSPDLLPTAGPTTNFSSGTLLQDGLIVTTRAGVPGADEIQVTFDGQSWVPATVLAFEEQAGWDALALLSCRQVPESANPIAIAPVEPKRGQVLTVIGNNFGKFRSVIHGAITNTTAESHEGIHSAEHFIANLPTRPGSQGAPAFNNQGDFLGVVTALSAHSTVITDRENNTPVRTFVLNGAEVGRRVEAMLQAAPSADSGADPIKQNEQKADDKS